MKSLDEQLAEYGAHHTKKGTIITHFIGVPAVILGLLILCTWIRVDLFDRYTIALAWFLVVGTLMYYFALDKKTSGIMAIVLLPITIITTWWTGPEPTTVSIIAFVILFVGGWIIQFVGHGIEQKRPAFLSNLFQLFIAPVYLVLEAIEMCGLSHYLEPKKKVTKTAKAKPKKTDQQA